MMFRNFQEWSVFLVLSKPVNCQFILIIEIRFDWHFKTRQDVNTVVFSIWMSAARSKV